MIDLSNRLEPHLGEIGSICTKTGSNDEDRTTDDCISRKQAIEAFEPTHYMDWYTPTIIETLETLPSVRPEVLACGSGELVQESDGLVNDLVKDCISRQAAIDLLKQMRKDGDMIPWEGKDVFARIRKLPSAQPETHDKRTETHECDLISRQAAIDAVKDLPNCSNGFSDTYDKACIIGVLEDLPTAQPQWIPCSKGLPKYPFRVQIQLDNGWIITGYYSEEHWYTVPHSGGFLRNDEVEAWRELPKPYDGGDAK